MEIERNKPHAPVTVNDEGGRPGDPALFAGVQQIPGFKNFPLRVTQEGERKSKLAPKGFRILRRVHG